MKTSSYDESDVALDAISYTASIASASLSQDTSSYSQDDHISYNSALEAVCSYTHEIGQSQNDCDSSTQEIDQSQVNYSSYTQEVDQSSCHSVTVPVNESSIPESEPEPEVRSVEYRDIEHVSPGEVTSQRTDTERWSDATSVSLPGQAEDMEIHSNVTSDTEPAMAQCEPVSEMYYTASSEVSLLSDTELPEKAHSEENKEPIDGKEYVIAGHVAAMRERFESMTRTNTPCPDLVRSLSPSLEVFRNASPSPDHLS